MNNDNYNSKNDSKKQKLFDDKFKKIKECARCHQILPYNKFFIVSGSSEKVRHMCKNCTNDYKRIYNYKKKLIVVLKFFNGKCSKCDIDIINLPAFQFHHPYAKFKTKKWRKIKGKNLQEIFEWIKRDRVDLLCANCHNSEQAVIYEDYKSLISKRNIFKMSAEEINKLIIKSSSQLSNKLDRMHVREKIKEWIKKRFVIEKLYNGQCIGCGEITVKYDLSALEFHHKDPNQKKREFKWNVIEHLDSKQIIDFLIKEQCVCLCANCHNFIHSRFAEFVDEALEGLEDFISLDNKTYLSEKIRELYQKIIKRINLYKIKINENDNLTPLIKEIPHTKIWKVHLLKIYYYTQITENSSFKAYDLGNILEITMRHVYKHLNNFIKKRLIVKDNDLRGVFKFTENGIIKVREFERKHKIISKTIREIIDNNLDKKK